MILAIFTVFSAGSITHGFVAYYTASKLLVTGQLGPLAYDDAWFGEMVRRVTASNIREIFTPNPPTMALMALPLVWLSAQSARAVWLFASLLAFIAGVAALVRHQGRRNRDVPVPVLMLMLLAPAVFSNLRVGQGYLIVFALFAAAILSARAPPRCARRRGARRAAGPQDQRHRPGCGPVGATPLARAHCGGGHCGGACPRRDAVHRLVDVVDVPGRRERLRAASIRISYRISNDVEPVPPFVHCRSHMESVARGQLRRNCLRSSQRYPRDGSGPDIVVGVSRAGERGGPGCRRDVVAAGLAGLCRSALRVAGHPTGDRYALVTSSFSLLRPC